MIKPKLNTLQKLSYSSAKKINKIKIKNPITELEGDEMTRIIWSQIKQKLILPYLSLPLHTFDLSLPSRILEPNITLLSAKSIKETKVGIKCATITPDKSRVSEYNINLSKYKSDRNEIGLSESEMVMKSPNGIIRSFLNGTVFREPIVVSSVPLLVKNWKKSIVIGRHAYGDQYLAQEINICGKDGRVELVYYEGDKIKEKKVVCENTSGVAMAMFNTDESITGFAHSCFKMALTKKYPLYLSTKNTILKVYDGRFKDIFESVYLDYKEKFETEGIRYEHRLIDDLVAQCIKGEGGFVWACKNYDGDVMSDIIAQGFGSLGLMTSVLLTPDGILESEAAHGTVTRHYREYLKGNKTSTNSIASIFAWTRGLKHRAELDNNHLLGEFCDELEKSCIDVVLEGKMTKDLALAVYGNENGKRMYLYTEEFIDAVNERLQEWVERKLIN